jgi:serine/threonine protein kinase
MAWGRGQLLQSGKYKIIEQIGIGGFGQTYLAVDLFLKEQVIIKRPYLNLRSDKNHEKYVRRFQREWKVLSQIKHPNVVRAVDFFEEEGIPCLVMEYVVGETLNECIRRMQYIPPEEALVYFRQLAIVLQSLHEQGLIHCDIHPGNIIVEQYEKKPVLIDFGSTKLLEPHTVTITTTVNDYFSPYEQRIIDDHQPTLDVYSLAATLYFAITGKKPQCASDRKMFGDKLIHPKQHRSDISEQLNRAILKGMSVEAKDRPSTMQAWINLLPVFNTVPKVFKVFATQPEIKILYINHIIRKICGLIPLVGGLIMLTPLLDFLVNTILLSLLINPFKFFVSLLNPFALFGLLLILLFAGIFFVMICRSLFMIVGSTRLSADTERVSIVYSLLGVSYQQSISVIDIINLRLYHNEPNNIYKYYRLDVMTNSDYNHCWIEHRLFLGLFPGLRIEIKNTRDVCIYSYLNDSESSKWLGELLANFYQIELRLS